MSRLRILLVEPFFSGSHAAWAEGLRANSRHQIELLTLPGPFWKWRMQGGALTLARMFAERPIETDLLLASDMLDLPTFLALTRRWTSALPSAIYFHENQVGYPLDPVKRGQRPRRSTRYALLNVSSALAADGVFFNSEFNRNSFLEGLPEILTSFPDFHELQSVDTIRDKSRILPLGLNLHDFDGVRPEKRLDCPRPLILWNHRWEHDKNPKAFFRAMEILQEEGLPFSLAVLGEPPLGDPSNFGNLRERFEDKIIQYGFVEDRSRYGRWLWEADLLPVTSHHDFFGVSVAEAIYCRTEPLLPRRLAYPELLSETDAEAYFYDTFRELVIRLRERASFSLPPFEERLRTEIARFDWTRMAPRYDEAFEHLCT